MPKYKHFRSECCYGEKCRMCGKDATHKVEESIMFDDPHEPRHPPTAYVCCDCFMKIMGPAINCYEE